MTSTHPAGEGGATIVTHSRVRAGEEDAFADLQREIGRAIAAFPGFIDQVLMPPSPPAQAQWVIFQWFARAEDALAWLNSRQRREFLEPARRILLHPEDVHLVKGGDAGAGERPAAASAMFSARVRPGAEADYRAWQHKITAALSAAEGFQGYRFEPPIPGIQDNWLAVVRFDSEADLRAWMESPERLGLIEEAKPFVEVLQSRTVRTGFDQWFRAADAEGRPAAWKMGMVVLMVLYPSVFLFDRLVGKPLLSDRGVPPWLAMFAGNVACVALLNLLVPWASRRFDWWLSPREGRTSKADLLGIGLIIGAYASWLLAFAAWSGRSPAR